MAAYNKSPKEVHMSTKSLTGWLLIAGPVLMFVVIGVLWEALIGAGETAADSVAEAMANEQLARILLVVGMIVFTATFVGLVLLARSMKGEDKPGATYADVAGIIFVAVAGASIVATGLSLGALDAAADSVSEGVTSEIVGNAVFAGVWVFWALGNLLLGSAMVMQKNLHAVVAWLLVGFGVFGLFTAVISFSDIPDAVGMVIWLGLTLTNVAAGVLVLRAK